MTRFISPREDVKLLVVSVPEDAYDFELKPSELFGTWVLTYKTKWRWEKYQKENWDWKVQLKDKPESLGIATELPEEVTRELVEWYEDSNDSSYDPQYNETTYFNVIKNYETGEECDTFTESFASFLRREGITERVYVLKVKG